MKRFILFLWVLSVDKRELVNIIHALSLRQSNGRGKGASEAYTKSKELAKDIPFKKAFIKDEN